MLNTNTNVDMILATTVCQLMANSQFDKSAATQLAQLLLTIHG